MALILKDRVKENTTSTGTGDITLAGTTDGFERFSHYMSVNDTTYYAIASSSADEYEIGIGTYSATNTLTRTTVLAGSNGTSKVNFGSGTKEVFMTYPAGKALFTDASGNLTLAGDLTLNADPDTALGAATKQYVDTIASAGIHYHDPVRVESPINLNATYNNGTNGVGATLTNAGTQAALVIDGVTLSTNDRVLIYEQTDQTQNGIYTVTNTGSASTNWVLTRATDADEYAASDPDKFGKGDAFFVKEGNTGAGELYVMNTSGEITFGTTNIHFSQVAETAVYNAGTGITLTGTTFSIGQSVGTTDNVTFNNVTASLTGDITGNADTVDNLHASSFLRSDANDTATGNITLSGTTTLGGQVNFTGVNGQNFVINTDTSRVVFEYQRSGTKQWTVTHTANGDINYDHVAGSGVFQVDGNQVITTAGSGLSKSGYTLSHSDTSSQVSINNSNGTIIQDVTLDTYGHVTGLNSLDGDARWVNVSGDTMTGNLEIEKNHPVLLLDDSGATTDADTIAYISFQKAGAEKGWIGWGAGSNTKFSIDNQLGSVTIRTASNERISVLADGMVGVGNTAPTEKLSVYGAVTSSYQAANFSTGPYRANMDIIGSTKIVRLGSITGADTATGDKGSVAMYVNNTETARFKPGGDMVIGTGASGAANKLFFKRGGGSDVGAIGWHTDSNFYIGGHPSYGPTAGNDVKVYGFGSDLHLGDNSNGNVITINYSTGNVGIYDTTPSYLLDVGSTKTTPTINVSGVGGTNSYSQLRARNPDDGAGHQGAEVYLRSYGWGEGRIQVGAWNISQSGGRMNAVTGNQTLYIDTGTGAGVGILSSSPSALLTVGNGSSFTLGGTAGDVKRGLDLLYDSANTDYLRFYMKRAADGADWQTADHYIQRRVDSTDMGFIKFGHHTASDLITFGRNTSEYMQLTGTGQLDLFNKFTVDMAQNANAPMASPHLHLEASATTNATGLTTLRMDTSTVDNYGITLNAARKTTDGTPTFELRTHYNSATGTAQFRVQNDGNIDIPSNIRHMGDTNTYFGFHVTDQWRVVTNNSERLEVTNTSVMARGDNSVGFTNDGNAKHYAWRAVNNTSTVSNQWYKIARIVGSQATRFKIDIVGHQTSYGDGTQAAMSTLVGSLNNDNNYDIASYTTKNASGQSPVEQWGQVDVNSTSTDIYVKTDNYSEIAAWALISDGTIETVSNESNADGVATEPTGYSAATDYEIWHSGSDGSSSGLDADLLDGYHESTFMRKSANSTLDMNNNNITEVNALLFNDPGPNEGLEWVGGSGWKVYESPDDLTTNSGGNLQFVTGTTRRMTLETDGDLNLLGSLTAKNATFDNGTTTTVSVKCDDGGYAMVRANGDSQGTGAIEVGQSDSYGGGMFYNGDNSPAFASGETADNIGFYRLDNGTRTEVFHYPYNSNTVYFNGDVNVAGHVKSEGPDGGMILRTWTGGSSFGSLATANMTSTEYVVISDGTNTYVSSGSGGNTIIRGPNNDSNPEIRLSGSSVDILGASAAWDGTTPGTAKGSLHFDPENSTDHYGSAITFGASDSSSGTTAQAGIYTRTDGNYGTRMYIATTDSYSSGSKTALYIDQAGNVEAVRGHVKAASLKTSSWTIDQNSNGDLEFIYA